LHNANEDGSEAANKSSIIAGDRTLANGEVGAFQGNRIKVNGKGGGLDGESTAGDEISCICNYLGGGGSRSVIPAAGTAHFVAYATIFEVAFQIQ
jgi:hypothetical protein